jgi:hypothetical protein
MTTEQILELAKTCGFEEFIGERDDETDGVYYQFWEEQLIEFAQAIYKMGNNTRIVSQPTSTISPEQSINRVER